MYQASGGRESRLNRFLASEKGKRVEQSHGFRFCVSRGLVAIVTSVPGNPPRPGGGRGLVTEFSARSAIRLRRYLRNCESEYRVFVTVTYPSGLGLDGPKAKRDIKCLLERMRRLHGARLGRDPDGKRWSVLWFLEFTAAGRVHFHLVCTHFVPKEWLAMAWYEIVQSDDERHLRAGTRVEGIRGGRDAMRVYAAKYVAKAEQKEVPEAFGWAGRFWGVWGCKTTVEAATTVKTDELNVRGIRESVEDVFNALGDAIAAGAMKKLKTKNPLVTLFCWSSAKVQEMVTRSVWRVERQIFLSGETRECERWDLELSDSADEDEMSRMTDQELNRLIHARRLH